MAKSIIDICKMQGKKVRSLLLAESFKRLGDLDRAYRIENCGTFLEVSTTESGNEYLTKANFCRERLCPTCSYRRSLRIFGTTSSILDYVEAHDKNIRYLFLTLTVSNCSPWDLSATLDHMAKSWNRMQSNRAWKRRVKGSMKTLEITVNHETGNFHPHYHIILVVGKDYFSKDKDLYWDHEDWLQLWLKSARLTYRPNIHITSIKGGRRKGVEEVSKYLCEDSDYILPDNPSLTDDIVSVLQEHLAGRRLISYNGCLRDAQKALKLADPDAGALVDNPDEVLAGMPARIRGDIVTAIRTHHWNAGLSRYTSRKEL